MSPESYYSDPPWLPKSATWRPAAHSDTQVLDQPASDPRMRNFILPQAGFDQPRQRRALPLSYPPSCSDWETLREISTCHSFVFYLLHLVAQEFALPTASVTPFSLHLAHRGSTNPVSARTRLPSPLSLNPRAPRLEHS